MRGASGPAGGPDQDLTGRSAQQASRRPFGAHVRMSRRASLVLLLTVPLSLLLTQIVLYLLIGVLTGDDDVFAPALTPLKLLAVNLGTGVTAVLAVVLSVRFARTSWREVFSSPRSWDGRRLAVYTTGSAVLVGVGVVVTAVVAPGATGWGALGLSGTTVALLAVVVLSTPIQAAGEEIAFRGVLMPAAASWFRRVRPAFVTGLVVSSLLFALVHGSSDPWLFGYYTFLSLCTATMGLLTHGLEAAVGFHVANNIITTTINVLFADGGSLDVERSAGTGGPELLILGAMNAAVLAGVWWRERTVRTVRVPA